MSLLNLPEGQKGWIAGIIDGEGCIIFARPRKEYPVEGLPRSRNAGDSVHVKVTNTDPRMLMKLQELAGGVVRPRRGTKKSCWVWEICTVQAAELLIAVLPYLVAKHDQAMVAMEFLMMRREQAVGVKMTPEEDARRDDIKRRLTLLKHRDFKDESVV